MENTFEYQVLNNEAQRQIIRRRVKDMATQARECDTIVFLDKSARPLSTAFISEWNQTYKERNLPNIRFLNIGTEKMAVILKWAEAHLSKPVDGKYRIEDIVNEKSLVDIFGQENINILKKLLAETKNALIVDDVFNSGRSMRLASSVMKAVRPEIKVGEFFLLESESDKQPFVNINRVFLPWRDSTGVEDKALLNGRDPYSQFGNENKKAFLSQPLTGMNRENYLNKSKQVRKEIRQLMTT